MTKPNGSDRFFSGTVTSMAHTELPKKMVEDRRFTHCPGAEINPACSSKVVILDGDMINYCCGNCWETVWATARQVPEDLPLHTHSIECGWRQERRINEPIVEGTFRINAAPTAPPTRL